MDKPRDVIARALFEIKGLGSRYNLTIRQADAIIAALNAAGFDVMKRTPKPEPDWGRRGTQPKGKLGPPPPPNGKRVASKPLPPTPGPFNPFGKQDLEGIVPSPILTDAFGEPTSIEEVAPNTFKYTWTDDDVESP